jgi:hypothetical protein
MPARPGAKRSNSNNNADNNLWSVVSMAVPVHGSWFWWLVVLHAVMVSFCSHSVVPLPSHFSPVAGAMNTEVLYEAEHDIQAVDVRGFQLHEAGAARAANTSLSLTHITPPFFHSYPAPSHNSNGKASSSTPAAVALHAVWEFHAILAACLRCCSSLVFSLPVLLALDGAWHIVGEVGDGVLAVDVAVAWHAYCDG